MFTVYLMYSVDMFGYVHKSANTVSTVLKKILEEYRVPRIIQHDRGKEFEGAFISLLKNNQIR